MASTFHFTKPRRREYQTTTFWRGMLVTRAVNWFSHCLTDMAIEAAARLNTSAAIQRVLTAIDDVVKAELVGEEELFDDARTIDIGSAKVLFRLPASAIREINWAGI